MTAGLAYIPFAVAVNLATYRAYFKIEGDVFSAGQVYAPIYGAGPGADALALGVERNRRIWRSPLVEKCLCEGLPGPSELIAQPGDDSYRFVELALEPLILGCEAFGSY